MVGLLLLLVPTQVERPALPEHAVLRLMPLGYRHEATVLEASLPGDRSRLFTLDAAGFLNAWDVAARRRIYRVNTGPGAGLVVSARGTSLALASPESQLRLFDGETGKELRRIDGVRSPAFSADGALVAAIDGRRIRRWFVTSGRELPGLADVEAREFLSLAMSPDASRIAAGFTGGLTLWDGVTGKRLDRCEPDENRPSSSLAFSADGTTLATAGLWGAHLFKVETRLSIVRTLDALGGRAVGFSKDGRRLLALHRGRHVQAWDVERGELIGEWRAHGDLDSERLAFSGDGEIVLRLRGDALQLLDSGISEKFEGITAASFSSDGRARTGDGKGRVRVWNTDTGQDEETLTVPGLPVRGFSLDGRRALLVDDASAVVWAGREIFRRKEAELALAALSPDGSNVAVYADRLLSVWNVDAGTTKGGRRDAEARVTALAFSPDSRLLAQGEAGGGLALTALDTGREVLRFAPRSDSAITVIAFSRDGARLAAGDAAGQARVLEEGKETVLVHSRRGPIRTLAFSPDGFRLAGAAERGGVFVCSLTAPYAVDASYTWAEAEPAAVSFSADSRRLLTGGRDGAVFIWALPESR